MEWYEKSLKEAKSDAKELAKDKKFSSKEAKEVFIYEKTNELSQRYLEMDKPKLIYDDCSPFGEIFGILVGIWIIYELFFHW